MSPERSERDVIPVDSIEAWHAPYLDTEHYGELLERMPELERRLDEYVAVSQGHADLVLPDGSRWGCPESMATAAPEEQVLWDHVMDHHVDDETHPVEGHHGQPFVLLNRRTRDPARAFCCVCHAWVDLTEVTRRFDAEGRESWADARSEGLEGGEQ